MCEILCRNIWYYTNLQKRRVFSINLIQRKSQNLINVQLAKTKKKRSCMVDFVNLCKINLSGNCSKDNRCCYIKVDSAMTASRNGFCSYKLSIHKKTIICRLWPKILQFFYLTFFHSEIVKLDHFMTLSLSYANTVLWRSRCKIHRFVAAPDNLLTSIHVHDDRLMQEKDAAGTVNMLTLHNLGGIFMVLCLGLALGALLLLLELLWIRCKTNSKLIWDANVSILIFVVCTCIKD